MAAGGFKEFQAGEVLDQDDINDYLLQGMLVFAGTAARGSAITSPVEGQFSFLADSDSVEFYDGSAWVEFESGPSGFNFIVAAGGGAGGSSNTAGFGAGGAGGAGGLSNGTAVLAAGSSFTVTIGAGGAVGASGAAGSTGNKTVFGGIIQAGGGGGGPSSTSSAAVVGLPGGCGGGMGSDDTTIGNGPGVGLIGFDGGSPTAADGGGGGGGGMGAVGGAGGAADGGAGGVGKIVTQITTAEATSLVVGEVSGSDLYFCGGGGGGNDASAVVAQGGLGGGGNGGAQTGGIAATTGDANSGGGGGGSSSGNNNQAAGGSGVVVLKYPSKFTLTIGGGLTASTITSGLFKVTAFKSNIVTEVITGRDEHDLVEGVTSWEDYYGAFRGQRCLRTSYNTYAGVHSKDKTPFRGNYAGIGFFYDEGLDAFIPPKADVGDWVLNEETFTWEPVEV
jgi:hypothetical protein